MNTCGECVWLNVKDKNTSCADIGITPKSQICKHFDAIKPRLIQLKTLVNNIDTKPNNPNWLDNFNASQAFLICIGAGPWKIKRRTFIQTQAVSKLGKRDLLEVENEDFGFPLEWQKQKVNAMINYLKTYKITMEYFTKFIADMKDPAQLLYEVTKTKGRAKVLDLFVRDYIKASAFPIDRWVARKLEENNFPQHEHYMIELCNMAGLDASNVARLFVDSSQFSGNSVIKL